VTTAFESQAEDRRTSFRAGVGPERQLAVVRKGKQEFTVWIRNVSSGGIGFAIKATARFKVEDKIVVVTNSGTFEGRVAHLTPAETGMLLVGVQRLKILEKLHAQIVERGDLPRTPAWIPSLIGWTATSAAVCAGLFFLETSGALKTWGVSASLAAPVAAEAKAADGQQEIADRFERIDRLRDPATRQGLALSPRQETHVLAIAEQTAMTLATIFVTDSDRDLAARTNAGRAALLAAESKIEELLDADQREAWRTLSPAQATESIAH
jgi:hypothetical protein